MHKKMTIVQHTFTGKMQNNLHLKTVAIPKLKTDAIPKQTSNLRRINLEIAVMESLLNQNVSHSVNIAQLHLFQGKLMSRHTCYI